ncbi:MAG: M67 family metallopeptidase [Fibrobacter sp.]|nr:M67 family metallopeptidase [Fibrobacter sp.]
MKIEQKIIQEIISHAQQESPIEACGYLAGDGETISHSVRLHNIDQSTDHYSLEPAEQFNVVRELRNAGLRVMAVYHSHPASPARMSAEDIRLAYDPDISYVIVSLQKDTTIKSFRVNDGVVYEEQLVTVRGGYNE